MRESIKHQADHRDFDVSFRGCWVVFKIPVQPSMKRQPGEGTLDDPAFWQNLEPLVPPFDHLQWISEHRLRPFYASPLVSSVHPYLLKVGKLTPQTYQHQSYAPSVRDMCRVYHHGQQQPKGIHGDMLLAPLGQFTSVVAALPPFCAVFTDRLSMMATLGAAAFPAWLRTASRRVSCIRSQIPFRRHRQ